jgi:colicin import membrane protein
MTAKVLHNAERAAEQADRAALHAHAVLRKVTTRDPRTMSFAPNQERVAFEKADAAARNADAEAAAAHAQVAKLRAGNGAGRKSSAKQTRLDLAAAIVAQRRARNAAQKNAAVIDASYSQAGKAQRQVEAAERNVERTREDDAEAAACAIASSRTPPPSSVGRAESKRAAAESVLDQVRVGRERLRERQVELDRVANKAKAAVESAINTVWRTERPLDRLLERASKLTDELINVQLELLHWRSFASPQEREQINATLRERTPGMLGEITHYPEHPVTKQITMARQALADDADAPVKIVL